jgi:poly-gamma-glutamate synthesis protein (capsule biosynthesis protein)
MEAARAPGPRTLFLCGDVMTGRGIDQALPHACPPRLYEPSIRDARDYVALAEQAHGPFARPLGWTTPWGEALAVLEEAAPQVRLINLETAITLSEAAWPGKDIHYRMHPGNVPLLQAARVDCCSLANNHLLDWGRQGLCDTLAALAAAGIATAGAGRTREEAQAPALLPVPGGRVLVFAFGHASSGVPEEWAAGPALPGLAVLPDLSLATARRVGERVRQVARAGDVVVASLHWGSNWGWHVPQAQRAFAHALIDEAGVHLVWGHSSHHPRPCEVYRGHLVLYGCGDFLNDYEGIHGYEEYRGDLTLLYLVELEAKSGRLQGLRAVPLQLHHFRLRRAGPADARWLAGGLTRAAEGLGTAFAWREEEGALRLAWGG